MTRGPVTHLDSFGPGLDPRGTDGRASSGSLPQEEPDPEALRQFQVAMSGQSEPVQGSPSPRDTQAPEPEPSPLLGLWHRPTVVDPRQPPPQAPRAESIFDRVHALLDRLLVGDGRHGGRSVQMSFSDDVLAGVTVTVQEEGGRWQLEFVCSVATSRQRLDTLLPDWTGQLARRLQREVSVRVCDDDALHPRSLQWTSTP